MKRWHFIAMAGLLLSAAVAQAAQVGLIKINGAIGPATESYIARAVNEAAAQNDECLVIQLDTPGGLLESTKQIVQTFYASKVPTVVYVAPSGASAGSAGVFITLAADVAAMAPNTSIGAAHPVEIGTTGGVEKTDDVMKTKTGKLRLQLHRNHRGQTAPQRRMGQIRRHRKQGDDRGEGAGYRRH